MRQDRENRVQEQLELNPQSKSKRQLEYSVASEQRNSIITALVASISLHLFTMLKRHKFWGLLVRVLHHSWA